MLKERIQEIFEFTKSESPYRKANKGWINQDIFLDLSPSSNTLKQKKEVAKVTLLWSPINSLLSNIFLILIIGSILVFTSLSFERGRFDFNLFNESVIKDIVKVEDEKFVNTSKLDVSESVKIDKNQNFEVNQIDKEIDKINLSDNNQENLERKIITNEIKKQDAIVDDMSRSKNIEVLKNKKSKSNFI